MPSIPGQVELNLSVRDPGRSAGWYAELLGMQTRYDHTSDNGRMRYNSHSGVNDPDYTRNVMLTFRDPDTSSSSSSGEHRRLD